MDEVWFCGFHQTQPAPPSPSAYLEEFHLFVIDDNMFYRSMRHEYVALAREAQCGLAIVTLEVTCVPHLPPTLTLT